MPLKQQQQQWEVFGSFERGYNPLSLLSSFSDNDFSEIEFVKKALFVNLDS